jgi:hypothetical protein
LDLAFITAQNPYTHYGLGIDSSPDRYEYQEFSWEITWLPALKAHNLTTICEPIV